MSRNRANGKFRDRRNEILFIDARNLGHLINRRTRELSKEDIEKIAGTYHNWRASAGSAPAYEDTPGFCAAAPISKVAELETQLVEEAQLNEIIAANLSKIKL